MSYANRGMGFESLIDHTCRMYEQQGRAIINKRPTPVKILGRSANGMIYGFLEKPSTVDYDGTYRGRAIVFEAKSTKELNRFPLSNVEQHQYEYLEKQHNHGAIAFLLIEFVAHKSIYLLPFPTLRSFWKGATKGGKGRGSISLDAIDVHAYPVETGRVPVDFLAVVDRAWNLAKKAV